VSDFRLQIDGLDCSRVDSIDALTISLDVPTVGPPAFMQCLLLAQSRLVDAINRCPLLGVKRTLFEHSEMSASDPKRTSPRLLCCDAVDIHHKSMTVFAGIDSGG